jgi:hypothetical protein
MVVAEAGVAADAIEMADPVGASPEVTDVCFTGVARATQRAGLGAFGGWGGTANAGRKSPKLQARVAAKRRHSGELKHDATLRTRNKFEEMGRVEPLGAELGQKLASHSQPP